MWHVAGNIGVLGSSHHHHHHKHRYLFNFRPSKLFVFGDSYADTGNYRKSIASSWKVPYGITFPGKPAGRFSDGRVLTDYVGGSPQFFLNSVSIMMYFNYFTFIFLSMYMNGLCFTLNFVWGAIIYQWWVPLLSRLVTFPPVIITTGHWCLLCL